MSLQRPSWWGKGHDHAVQIDQRALVDKILARYAAEFSVFRELLQNSDDANSKEVEIHFESRDDGEGGGRGLSDLRETLMKRYVVKNNGMHFRDQDWARLKKIADGNPDVEKIGAFGIGFYSVFSVTEKPFIVSGDRWMGFYWKGDQLVARRGHLDPSTPLSEWTTTEIPLRVPSTMPKPFELLKFITTSLTFMKSLERVTVFVDGVRLGRVTKRRLRTQKHELLVGDGKGGKSESGMMQVKGIESTVIDIHTEFLGAIYIGIEELKKESAISTEESTSRWKKSFFSSILSTLTAISSQLIPSVPLPPPNELIEKSISLTIFSAKADVLMIDGNSENEKLQRDLERSTKKKLPKEVVVDVVYTGKHAYDQEIGEKLPKGRSLFEDLRASLDGRGGSKIFIGHATSQTTGFGGHMASSRFIPTAEREAVDFVDPSVSAWNKELLFVGGYLCRAIYENDLSVLDRAWKSYHAAAATAPENGPPGPELLMPLKERGMHALRFFSFDTSTPSPMPSTLIEGTFFLCGGATCSVMTNNGVLDASLVKLPVADFEKLVRKVSLMPLEAMKIRMVEALRVRGLLKDLTWADVVNEVKGEVMSQKDMTVFLREVMTLNDKRKWWIQQAQKDELIAAATFKMEGGDGEGKVIKLSTIKSYVDDRKRLWIDPEQQQADLPFPEDTLPYAFSKAFNTTRLATFFNTWYALTITLWLENIFDILSQSSSSPLTPEQCTKLLHIVALHWRSMTAFEKKTLTAKLMGRAIVPTPTIEAGLSKAEDAYFASVHRIPGLPIVEFDGWNGRTMRQLLAAMGVKQRADIKVLMERMYNTGAWTYTDLITYLTGVRRTLTPTEMAFLKTTPLFVKRGDENKTNPPPIGTLMRANELYEPNTAFQQMGLPVVYLKSLYWRRRSAEAKLLYGLGLNKIPSAFTLVEICERPLSDPTREHALQYIISNWEKMYRIHISTFTYRTILPARSSDKGLHLVAPNQAYTDARYKLLGFSVVQSEYVKFATRKLSVAAVPTSATIIELLKTSVPMDIAKANEWFSLLSSSVTSYTGSQTTQLSNMAFIPYYASVENTGSLKKYKPSECYLTADPKDVIYSQIFRFVDGFSTDACVFLRMCGAKDMPTADDIMKVLTDDPNDFIRRAQGEERFFEELRAISVKKNDLSTSVLNRVKATPCLLGQRRYTQQPASEDSEEIWEYSYEFALPQDIVIADDIFGYVLFGDMLLAAPPRDELLEALYSKCGSPSLHSMLKQELKPSKTFKDKEYTDHIRSLVQTRLALFFHQRSISEFAVDYNWLLLKGNFKVKGAKTIRSVNSLTFKSKTTERTVEVSAAALRESRNGPIVLWVTRKVDMFEVADTMLALLLHSHTVSDSLIMSSLLSADTGALRRRGYNVDRMYRKPKWVSEKAPFTDKDTAPSVFVQDTTEGDSLPPFPGPAAPPPHYETIGASTSKQGLKSLFGKFRSMRPSASTSTSSSSLHVPSPSLDSSISADAAAIKAKLAGANSPYPRPVSMPPPRVPYLSPLVIHSPPTSAPVQDNENPDSPVSSVSDPDDDNHESEDAGDNGSEEDDSSGPDTPLQATDIEKSIQAAIRGCKPMGMRAKLFVDEEEEKDLKKSLGVVPIGDHNMESIGNIKKIGDVDGVIVHSTVFPSERTTLFTTRALALHNFSSIITKLSQLFRLDKDAIRILHTNDISARACVYIEGAYLLNFDLYEEQDNKAVGQGYRSKAYTFWFKSLAGEIARNSESEIKRDFADVCRSHLTDLAVLLSERRNPPPWHFDPAAFEPFY